jgi:hypothetical protein
MSTTTTTTTTTSRPARNTTPRDERPISERQEAYIGRLQGERDLTGAPASVTDALARIVDLSNQAAGDLIDALTALPVKPEMEPSPVGYYVKDGALFKVQSNKKGTSTYALRLSFRSGKVRFDYDRDAGRAFGPKPMTLAATRKAVAAALVKGGLDKEAATAVALAGIVEVG